MDFSNINWLAVVVCVIVNMVIGSAWYNPKTFYPVWRRGIGRPENDASDGQNMAVLWGLTVLAALVQAIFMALMVHAMNSTTAGAGALTGFLLWLGFVAPTYLVNKLFAGHGLKIWAIEAGNHLVDFLAMGAILGAWH